MRNRPARRVPGLCTKMTFDSLNHRAPARPAIESLIAEHGGWRVIVTVAGALLRRRLKPPPVTAEDLPVHIRRDIGLHTEPRSKRYWEVR